jgi:hypothetical protein
MVRGGAADGRVVVYRCPARTRPGHVSCGYHCGAGQHAAGMLTRHHSWAWAKAVLGAGGRRSGLTVAEGLPDRRRARLLLPQQTCIRGAVMLVAQAAGSGAGSLARALGAEHSSARNDPGCCCGMGAALFGGALGRRLRWVADGCLFAVRARGGCVMFARGWTGHWRAVLTVVRCRADQ